MSSVNTLKKIKNAINKFSMLTKGDSVLVGFSGGKDSVVLLHALRSLAEEYGIKVSAIHVNHNIRGDEAKRDEDFCRDFCKKYGIEFYCKSVFAIDYSRLNKIGLEEGARILRYGAFKEICIRNSITKIATAHTASDNLETVLFNVARGCSMSGLKGIPPVRDNVIRPLIYCTTEEILQYAAELSLDYVTDSTNSDTDYSRNRIRHNVVPQLKAINPSLEATVTNMCHTVRTDLDFISSQADANRTQDTQKLSKLHPSLLSRLIADMYGKVCSVRQLEYVHLSEITHLLYKYSEDCCLEVKKVSLPGEINFVITPKTCFFEKNVPPTVLKQRPLTFGLTEFEETREALLVTQSTEDADRVLSQNIYKKSIHTVMKKSSLADTIIRGRLDGDVFAFSNMTKKVKKMMNEAKIPIEKRDLIPIICGKNGILWIAGFPVRDDARPVSEDETVQIYYLTREN